MSGVPLPTAASAPPVPVPDADDSGSKTSDKTGSSGGSGSDGYYKRLKKSEEFVINGKNKEGLRRLQWKSHPKLKGRMMSDSMSDIDANFNFYFHADSATDEHEIFEGLPKEYQQCLEWGWERHTLKSTHPKMKPEIPRRRSHSITRIRRVISSSEKTSEMKKKTDEIILEEDRKDDEDENIQQSESIIEELLLIGGFTTEMCPISVWRIPMSLDDCTPVTTFGNVPDCRWSHSATYIEPINAIFFYGGFNRMKNWSDPGLLFLDDMHWFDLHAPSSLAPGIRALHTAVGRYRKAQYSEINDSTWKMMKQSLLMTSDEISLLIKSKPMSEETEEASVSSSSVPPLFAFEIFMFGGQYCISGGHYRYLNDLYSYCFYSNGCVQVKNLSDDQSGDIPEPRGQHYSCILGDRDSKMWMFGGGNETTTMNDLYKLNLDNLKWTKIEYSPHIDGIDNVGPPPTKALKFKAFNVASASQSVYVSKQLKKMLVFYFPPQSKKLKSRKKVTHSSVKKTGDEMKDEDDDPDCLKSSVDLDHYYIKPKSVQPKCVIYVFDFNSRQWSTQITNNNLTREPNSFNRNVMVRVGPMLVSFGGVALHGVNRMRGLVALKLPLTKIKWDVERLVWIGFHKHKYVIGSDISEDFCLFGGLSKDLITEILSFFKFGCWI